MLEAEAKERQREHGGTAPGKPKTVVEKIPQVNATNATVEDNKSRAQAAKLVGTNERYVSDAKKIKQEAPEVFDLLK